MTDHILTTLRHASPIGQLERHEATLPLLEDAIGKETAQRYRREIECARAGADRGKLAELRVHVARAWYQLVVLELEHGPDVKKAALHTAPNKGTQKNTREKIEFVHRALEGTDEKSRQGRASIIFEHPERKKHFKGSETEAYNAIYRFLGRSEFL